jgi:photosynthetic reaction center H subunit
VGNDQKAAGKITDMWVDVPEQLVRYLEATLEDGTKRLIPMQMVRIKSNMVYVNSIDAASFTDAPLIASDAQITKLEEEKVSGFYAGGYLYRSDKRVTSASKLGILMGMLSKPA